ncbi:MAG: winged helix-turn-helix domain-containing protein [Candidatus Heimdallarchaeota archaeon]
MNSETTEPELDEQALFEILSHSLRRQILRELFQNSFLTYSDLQKALGHGPGVIYHHLQKLQELGFIDQRMNKEYELTPKGHSLVVYMGRTSKEGSSIVASGASFQNYFLKIPLANIVLENPIRWMLELGFILVVMLAIQIDFPILVIGPFLLPSEDSFQLRIALQFAFFFIMAVLLEGICLSWTPPTNNQLPFLSGLLVLPALSAGGVGLLWGLSIAFSEPPTWSFWLFIAVLNASYLYVIIHLLLRIKELSFERAVILALLTSYFFLFCVYFLG